MSVLLGTIIYLNKWRKEIWITFRLLSMMLYKDLPTIFSCSAMLWKKVKSCSSTAMLPYSSQQLAFTTQLYYYSFIIYLVFISKTKGPPSRRFFLLQEGPYLERSAQISIISKCHCQGRVYSIFSIHFNGSNIKKPSCQVRPAQSESCKMFFGMGKNI